MQLISDSYKQLNEELHNTNKKYGTSGVKYVGDIVTILQTLRTQDVLDYGCGKSTLAMNLPFTIKQYDPAIKKYSALPEPADVVVCTDVLEHIEPELIDNVLKHLASLTKRLGYLSASTKEAKKILSDGRNAHLIVQPSEWWREKISEYFHIKHTIENPPHVVFVVEPKLV